MSPRSKKNFQRKMQKSVFMRKQLIRLDFAAYGDLIKRNRRENKGTKELSLIDEFLRRLSERQAIAGELFFLFDKDPLLFLKVFSPATIHQPKTLYFVTTRDALAYVREILAEEESQIIKEK